MSAQGRQDAQPPLWDWAGNWCLTSDMALGVNERERLQLLEYRQFSGYCESRAKYSSPDKQALKASSLSQPLKIHAGRLSASVLSLIICYDRSLTRQGQKAQRFSCSIMPETNKKPKHQPTDQPKTTQKPQQQQQNPNNPKPCFK